MNEKPLLNSRRWFERLSYSPLILPQSGDAEPGDALGLASMVRSLELTTSELDALDQNATPGVQQSALKAIRNLTEAATGSTSLAATQQLAGVPLSTLQWFGEALGQQRSDASGQVRDGLRELDQQMSAHSNRPATLESPPRAEPLATMSLHPAPNQYGPSETPSGDRPIPTHLAAARVESLPLALELAIPAPAFPVVAGVSALVAAELGAQLGSRVDRLTSWGLANATEQTTALIGVLRWRLPPTLPITSISSGLGQLLRRRLLVKIFLDALTRRSLQPLGLLHLERLEMSPLAVERGELVYSLPLSPKEKVTLAHREWTLREEQFSELISDHLENFSETGVATSSDIAVSTATQASHSNTLDMGQPMSAKSTSVTLTSPVSAGGGASVVADSVSREEAREQTRTLTAKASTRTIQDHKTSFTVTTVAGMEDFTAHVLENHHADKVMLVDYFARVRHWRSELYRYGVRLAYDVVLPDPGARLRTRWTELLEIDDELRREFEFDLAPSGISRASWRWLAQNYGVALPPPPEPTLIVETARMIETETPFVTLTTDDGVQWTTAQRVLALVVNVPDGYRVEQLNVFANVRAWNNSTLKWLTAIAGRSWMSADADADGFIHLDWNRGPLDVPPTGAIEVAFRTQNAMNGELKLTLSAVPTDTSMDVWQAQCYVLLREAAGVRDGQHRAYLRDRAATLRRAIAAEDILHLRRLEREQIMRLVLSWLFPGFDDAASVLGGIGTPGSLDASAWQHVMEYGEYIKFVQNAIDWDKVTVFLYPYFWDSAWQEHAKLFLEHPDPVHREFLRAGAARVIIAIKPGFEEEVVSLLDKGKLGKVTSKSRFASVISEVQEANADYAASIRRDDKPGVLGGVLIGSWTDYTPTSGIDMDVTLTQVLGS